jgi:hypothetical protein
MTRQHQSWLPNWEIKKLEKSLGFRKSRMGIDTQLSIWHAYASFCIPRRKLPWLGYPHKLAALAEYKTHEILLLFHDTDVSDLHFPRCLRPLVQRAISSLVSFGWYQFMGGYVSNRGFCFKYYSE